MSKPPPKAVADGVEDAAIYTNPSSDSSLPVPRKTGSTNPFTGEAIDDDVKLWFKPMNNGSMTVTEEDVLPVICRKGWVTVTRALPATREMRLKAAGQGMLCAAEMKGRTVSFFEVFACMSVNQIYSLEVTSFRSWSFEDQHMIEVLGGDCSVTFITKEGPESLAVSCGTEHKRWARALAMVLTVPNFQSSWVLQNETLPKPWAKFEHGYFGASTMFSAKMNKVTPVVLRHISVADPNYPNTVDEISQYNFLRETLLSFKIQGPGILQLYGIFWDAALPKSGVLDYFIVMELCEGGTLMDALYENSADGEKAVPRTSKLSDTTMRQLLLELLSGLIHLHGNQIVHRNLKPSTVALLRPIGQMDQVSSGIVKILDLSHSASLGDQVAPGYAQPSAPAPKDELIYPRPEMASNIHAQLPTDNPQIDIFSFGLILCEMMSQERPWPLLQHLPMYKIERMVQFGSRPRVDDQGRLGMAGLVRLCLMPDREDRPALMRVLDLVRHGEFFSTFECFTLDDILKSLDAEFWTWSATIYQKVYDSCALLWDSDIALVDDREAQLLKLIKIARRHFQKSQRMDNETNSLFLLPIEAVSALVLGTNGLAEQGGVLGVFKGAERQFILDAIIKSDTSAPTKETTRLVQIAVTILREELEAEDRRVATSVNTSRPDIRVDAAAADALKALEGWVPLIASTSAFIKSAVDSRSAAADGLPGASMQLLRLMSSHAALAQHLSVSEEVVDQALHTAGVTAVFQRNAVQMLRNLASYPFVRVSLTRSMGTILANLRAQKNKEQITLDCLSVLNNITRNSLGAAEFVQRGGIVVLIPIALQYGQKHPIFLECFQTLEQVSLEPAHAIQVANEQAAMHAISVLKNTVRSNTAAKQLDGVCFSLVSCIIEYPALQIELVDLGIIPIIANFSRQLDDLKIMAGIASCLKHLAKADNYRAVLVEEKAHQVLMKILGASNDGMTADLYDSLYSNCFSAVNSFSADPAIREEMAEGEVIRSVVDIMKQHNRNATLQLAGLGALAHFVGTQEGRVMCENDGAIATARLILTQHSEDVTLLKASLLFMSKLVSDPKTRPDTIKCGLVGSLVQICKLESANMELIEASVMMLSTIAHHEDCHEEYERLQVNHILQGLMDACPLNELLQQHGAQIQQLAFPRKLDNGNNAAEHAGDDARAPFKLVVVGEMSVGKTCFVMRACQNTFSPDVRSTVGVHIDFARIEFPQRQIVLQVYDTAGEERYRAHSRSFYRGAQCAILVYDVTRHDTFAQLQSFHDEVLSVVDDGILFFVVGTKNDLRDSKQVDPSEAKKFARAIGAQHFAVSSIMNTGVHGTFRAVCEALHEKWPDGPPCPDKDTIKLQKAKATAGCCT